MSSTGYFASHHLVGRKTSERFPTEVEDSQGDIRRSKAKLNEEWKVASQTLDNPSQNHLSELDLAEKRSRLQKQIEKLEPLPELLKQAEVKNERLQERIDHLEKRLADRSAMEHAQ